MAVAPQAIWDCDRDLKANPHKPASYVMAGIVGDAAHSFGYHLAPAELPAGDYSFELPRDTSAGYGNPNASAWDLSFNDADMQLVTNRLLTAAKKHDARLKGVREFCGTTDGSNTHPYDLSNDQDGPLNSWDKSHLNHVHISFYRDVCDNYNAIKTVVDVICGVSPAPAVTEEDMRIVLNKDRVVLPILVGGGGDKVVTVLRNSAQTGALVRAGVPQVKLSNTDYTALRAMS